MSRVGKSPVAIPEGVQVDVADGNVVVKGKLGELSKPLNDLVEISLGEAEVTVKPANDSKESKALWGTYRSIISNMVQGVAEGFNERVEINGVGYRSAFDGKILTLSLGYSHEIKYAIPSDIQVKCEKPTLVVVSGCDKQKVGQIVGELMKLRPVEPYKGKGVYKEGSYIRRKEGKKK